ncbi:MAG: hypothetical protein JWP35_3157 [Caulobacter sp.]|nr:hypothetical protein [Caulobacter sp.]
MVFADSAVRPTRPTPAAVLDAAARGAATPGGLAAYVAALAPGHPLYRALQQGLADEPADDPGRRLILTNLERARALPADPGRRFVLVDAAAARLWMYEDGRPIDSMKVVVGKLSDPTPALCGLIRQAVFQPYWNVPVDLVRRHLAPDVLRDGTGVLTAKNLEVLSDWTPRAQVIDPAAVDWRAAASGQQFVRVRQRSGAGNMLGAVKFTFPNRLGIYLHDTPERALFAEPRRTRSSGCVRLEDARRFGRWLFGPGGAMDHPPAGIDVAVALPRPAPVYITYLTLGPDEAGRLSPRPDVYGRDAAVIAQLDAPRTAWA